MSLSASTPKPASAEEPATELEHVREENRQLRQALASHRHLDQAIGALSVLGQISPREGFSVLREISQSTNTELIEVAEQVLKHAQGTVLPWGTSPCTSWRTSAERSRRWRSCEPSTSDAVPRGTPRSGPARSREPITDCGDWSTQLLGAVHTHTHRHEHAPLRLAQAGSPRRTACARRSPRRCACRSPAGPSPRPPRPQS